MSIKEAVLAAFPSEADKAAALGILNDVVGLADWLGTSPGVVAYALKEVGQERLNQVTTKSELGGLVVDVLVEEEDQEQAKAALASTDADYDEPPRADFRLFTQVDEVLKAIHG